MLTRESILEGSPIPSVEVNDLRQVWSLLNQISEPPGAAISSEILRERCSPQSDPLAVYLRATLLIGAAKQGLLKGYQNGNRFRDEVFDRAAAYPIPKGLQNVDPGEFVSGLSTHP